MSTNRDVDRVVRSWLEEGVTALPDGVLDQVLDQLRATPQRRSPWLARRFPHMRAAFRIAVAALVVVVAAFVGSRILLSDNHTGSPSRSTSPSPIPEPTSLPAQGELAPGRYWISDTTQTPVRFSFAVPAGWSSNSDGIISKHKGLPTVMAFSSWIVSHIYANACHWTGTLIQVNDSRAAAVTELANALGYQKERTIVGPTDLTVGGYPAKRIELSAPNTTELAACDQGIMRLWPDAGPDESGGWHTGRMQRRLNSRNSIRSSPRSASTRSQPLAIRGTFA